MQVCRHQGAPKLQPAARPTRRPPPPPCRRHDARDRTARRQPAALPIDAATTTAATTILLLACGATGLAAERLTSATRALGAPMLSLCAGLAAASTGALPAADCLVYDAVWRYAMPLAAALMMIEHDVSRLLAFDHRHNDAAALLAAFLLGAATMVAGALAAWALFGGGALGAHGGALAACLCGSNVGGSINFLALAHVLKLPASALPLGMACDNLGMAAALALLLACPVGGGRAPVAADDAATAPTSSPTTPASGARSLVAAACAAALGERLAALAGAPSMRLLAMSLVALALSVAGGRWWNLAAASTTATAASRATPLFTGATRLGALLMLPFFATIGASSCGCLAVAAANNNNSLNAAAAAAPLLAFIAVMCAVHFALLAGVGAALRLPRRVLLLASNALIGGPATAASMAAARGWPGLMQPAMLVGSLGYALGTAAGMAFARAAALLVVV